MALSKADALVAIQQAANGSLKDLASVLTALVNRELEGTAQTLTASGAVTPGVQSLNLNHASVVIAATIADASKHAGFFAVLDSSASGTAAHTVTLTRGTWDGTNKTITLNAPGESLIVFFDAAGNGQVVLNTGSVAIST
ncbi:hypothetical protein DEM27_10425 [Metarhizobium album]|uniref:Uncharacterized protein n=1 Tax=Metarhizobium album TaxID=2182425 RepID=A0A2U2DU69_9HYPH|nr:hypothetical protein [Rhizobium album]PWE56769.1 hypothetical protein DEM27_10425 [Rhizobium album]